MSITPPTITGFADFFSWSNNLVDGLLGYLIVLAIGIITYTTLTTYTNDEKSAIMSAAFMMLISSLSWMYILQASNLMGMAILSAILLVAAWKL